MRLKDKIGIITGAGQGIGRGCAVMYGKEGAKLVVCARRQEMIEETVEKVEKIGGTAVPFSADVSKSKDVEKLVESTVKRFGRIDFIHNNAGIQVAKSIEGTTEEEWDEVVSINLKGVWLCCKYVVPVMKKQGKGSIINTGSIAAIVGWKNQSAYEPAKAGVHMLTTQLAVELAPYKIRVNCIAPGWIDTPLTDYRIQVADDPEKERQNIINSTPLGRALGRMGSPEDVSYAGVYFASDESEFVTGATIVVDGGYITE